MNSKKYKHVKYSETQIRQVCSLLLDPSLKYEKISEITGVGTKLISDIRIGRRWQEISKDYHFPVKKWNEGIRTAIEENIKAGENYKSIANKLQLEYANPFICYCSKVKSQLANKK